MVFLLLWIAVAFDRGCGPTAEFKPVGALNLGEHFPFPSLAP